MLELHEFFEFHHSSFLAGAPVASAGEIDVADGLLLMNNNDSGHYKPNSEHNDQFVSEMKDRGIDASKTREYVKRIRYMNIYEDLKLNGAEIKNEKKQGY